MFYNFVIKEMAKGGRRKHHTEVSASLFTVSFRMCPEAKKSQQLAHTVST